MFGSSYETTMSETTCIHCPCAQMKLRHGDGSVPYSVIDSICTRHINVF